VTSQMMMARTMTAPRTYHHILEPPPLAIGADGAGPAGGGVDCGAGAGVGEEAGGCSMVCVL